eukprot:CAMPEP_0206222054 /NCGR_PEP_ID=MMETSP0047_2-20121206/5755_1 /ASSEMBLY_ACC=CAM_ASM_000192 /TAXON_ID=195065 /ORGANISM="Chroomonas mesostigmatica_cf, Strain CCMP1168" /LENGTH=123 /DNA_ID=CAMNT_0053644853 /DNA_START=182 /DNA_END=549 /DNA_ORIENTATION=-
MSAAHKSKPGGARGPPTEEWAPSKRVRDPRSDSRTGLLGCPQGTLTLRQEQARLTAAPGGSLSPMSVAGAQPDFSSRTGSGQPGQQRRSAAARGLAKMGMNNKHMSKSLGALPALPAPGAPPR